jgi:hypothetical protein
MNRIAVQGSGRDLVFHQRPPLGQQSGGLRLKNCDLALLLTPRIQQRDPLFDEGGDVLDHASSLEQNYE